LFTDKRALTSSAESMAAKAAQWASMPKVLWLFKLKFLCMRIVFFEYIFTVQITFLTVYALFFALLKNRTEEDFRGDAIF
jgi:hypothetical protein